MLIFVGSALMMADADAQTLSASEIVRKADEKFNGEKSSIMVMSMTIIRPHGSVLLNLKTGPLDATML